MLAFATLPAAAAATDGVVETPVARVVAIGDVHGAHAELVRLLTGIGLIDADGAWQGGATHLVSVGDLLDRGADSRRVMDLFIRLQREAAAAGGAVHVVLGNHELLNLTNDLTYVSEGEFAALGGAAGLRAAFSTTGAYGQWLLTLPVALRINDTLFLHGGLSSGFPGVAAANEAFRRALGRVKLIGEQLVRDEVLPPESNLLQPEFAVEKLEGRPRLLMEAASDWLFNERGPLWYRGNASCHPVLEQSGLAASLERAGVRRVVMGHTPTASREIESRMGGMVHVIDTGMLASVYKGNPRALELTARGVRALTPDGTAEILNRPGREARLRQLLTDGRLEEDEEDNWWAVLGTDRVRVDVLRGGRKALRRQQAAFAMDRLLELYFVPMTVPRELNGRQVLIAARARRFSESARPVPRPNECEAGSVCDLGAAFDSLIGKRDRGGENLLYNVRNWEVILIDHANTFDTRSTLPAYAQVPALTLPVEERLAALDETALTAALGDLLDARAIRAVLKRRDRILTWREQQEAQ